MIIRKPTTITLKPEDDYQEYEDFRKRQEDQKKSQNQQKKEMFNWQQQQPSQLIHQVQNLNLLFLQAPKNTRRSLQVAQEPCIEFEPDTFFDINNQIPVNQLFRMINPPPDQMQQEPQ